MTVMEIAGMVEESAPRNANRVPVQMVRKGQIIVEGKTRTLVRATEVQPRGCRGKVHVNSDCYDYGAEVWVQR